MKRLAIISLLLIACESDKDKALKLVQDSKVQFDSEAILGQALFLGYNGLSTNSTWLDYANAIAKKEMPRKYKWVTNETNEKSVFIVGFVDDEDWGYRWEVTLKEQIVQYINDSDYLNLKHGMSRLGGVDEFQIVNIKLDTLETIIEYSFSSGKKEKFIIHQMKASLLNKTDKRITSGSINGDLKLIFKDKTVKSESDNFNFGTKGEFAQKLSKSNPWNPGTTREFKIRTGKIDLIYLEYLPEYVLLEIGIAVEDPIGFSFDKNILEKDVIQRWINLQQRESERKASRPSVKTRIEGDYKVKPKESNDITTENQWQPKRGNLSAWKIGGITVPPLPNDETGEIVFEIMVSDNGEVLGIRTIESSLTQEAEGLIRKAIQNQSLERTRDNVPHISSGLITFKFSNK